MIRQEERFLNKQTRGKEFMHKLKTFTSRISGFAPAVNFFRFAYLRNLMQVPLIAADQSETPGVMENIEQPILSGESNVDFL